MSTKTAFLALLPIGTALLAGAALPPEAAGSGHAPGGPPWDTVAAFAAGGIIALAMALLLRLRAAAERQR